MTSVNVQSPSGDLARSVELPDDVFDVQVNVPLIHQVVVAQLAAARQGTHDTKSRGEVRGGGRKPYRQKGTGRARQGSIRAPQFTGGGTVHGPTPRNYEQRTPKKMKAAALRGALSDRARGGRLHVVASVVDGDEPSTKTAAAALLRIVSSRHVLFVAEREDVASWKSLRNIESVHIIAPDQLNTYDVLISDDVVFTEGALAAFLAPSSTRAGRDGGQAGPKLLDSPTPTERAEQLGEAVETLAPEPAGRAAPVHKDAPAKKAAAKKAAAKKAATKKAAPAKKAAVSDSPATDAGTTPATGAGTTPATGAGTTTQAGEGVSDAEMAAEVAEQTTPDLKAEEAFEKAAEKKTDDPAEQALADEAPQLGDDDELGGES
jgi:large subunit ribosomal protein L4